MLQEVHMSRKRRKFSPEYKQEVVELVRTSGKPVAQLCAELGVGETAVRRWVAQAEQRDAGPSETQLSTEERAELKRLRRENKRLFMEREILKKATAFFAKESD